MNHSVFHRVLIISLCIGFTVPQFFNKTELLLEMTHSTNSKIFLVVSKPVKTIAKVTYEPSYNEEAQHMEQEPSTSKMIIINTMRNRATLQLKYLSPNTRYKICAELLNGSQLNGKECIRGDTTSTFEHTQNVIVILVTILVFLCLSGGMSYIMVKCINASEKRNRCKIDSRMNNPSTSDTINEPYLQ